MSSIPKSLLPRLYLGTMTFGWSQASSVVDVPVAAAMLKAFVDAGGVHVDTARIYSNGECEAHVAKALEAANLPRPVSLGTKAHPSQADGISVAGLQRQLDTSLAALNVTAVDEYYLHQPDPSAPLLDSLRFTHALVQRGVAKRIGMSNYHADEMARAFQLCEEHGLTKPSVYQGLYNPLNRMAEAQLLPVLRAHGCAFVAYNPLAAGLLTGRHSRPKASAAEAGEVSEVPAGRFKDNPNYLPRFYTDANFAAVESIRAACDAHGVSMVEAAYRWLLRHSALRGATGGQDGDGVLIGASSLQQLEQNLAACRSAEEAGDLPAAVLAAMDAAWGMTEAGAFPYWRSYSADMPGRGERPQGAAYSAAKTTAK